MGEVIETECLNAEHLTLRPGFHDEVSQPFSLGKADVGKLQAELIAVDPPNNGLVDSEGPLKVRKEQ